MHSFIGHKQSTFQETHTKNLVISIRWKDFLSDNLRYFPAFRVNISVIYFVFFI